MMSMLTRSKIGTNEVMRLTSKICSRLGESKTTSMVNIVMKWKVQDAQKEFNRQRYENTIL